MFSSHTLRSTIPLTTLLALSPAATRGALLTVCPSFCDAPTLAGAIAMANPGDVIRVTASPHTEADVLVDKDLTIEGLGETVTILQAATTPMSGAGRILEVAVGATVLVRDLALRNGDVDYDCLNYGNRTYHGGGAVLNRGTLELRDVSVYDNVARSGGGIANVGHLLVRRGLIYANRARFGGGAASMGMSTAAMVWEPLASVTATFLDATVTGNLSTDQTNCDLSGGAGGGIHSNAGHLAIIDSFVLENTAEVSETNHTYNVALGGGVWACHLTVVDSQIIGNVAVGVPGQQNARGALGGGVMVGWDTEYWGPFDCPAAEIHGSIISFNQAKLGAAGYDDLVNGGQGGGIYHGAYEPMRLYDTAVSNNIASSAGGGLYSTETIGLYESLVNDNAALTGGGLWGGVVRLRNVTVAANHAALDGGGMYVGAAHLANATLTDNVADDDGDSAGEGGGLFIAAAGVVELRNTIISGNVDASPSAIFSSADCSGELTSYGHNLIGTLGTAPPTFTKPCTLNQAQESTGDDLVGANPVLGPLQDNGGPTMTHALLPGSAAIDSGDPAGCFQFDDNALIPWDQRGADRVGICDRGAYEAASIPSKLFADGFESGGTFSWSAAVAP